jgi:hypothetical protein
MGIRTPTQNAAFSNLPWFDADFPFDAYERPWDYRPTSDEMARTRLEVRHFIDERGVTHCPTRYATITQACVPPTIPAKPLKRLSARSLRRRSR